MNICRPRRGVATLWSLAVCVVVSGCVGPGRVPEPASTRAGRWRQDLHYMADNLERLHKDPFANIKEEEFGRIVERIDRSIDSMDDVQVVIALMRLGASVRDAHTGLRWWNDRRLRRYPLGLRWFSDGIYVTHTSEEYGRALGCRLVRVGRWDIAEVCLAVRELIPHENRVAFRQQSPRYVIVPEILHALGYVEDMDKGRFVFQDAQGREFELQIAPLTHEQRRGVELVSAFDREQVPRPVYLKNDTAYWYEYLEDSKTLYCQYNQCLSLDERPFDRFASEVLDFPDSHPVERFVLDLRRNGGGDSQIAQPLITGLAKRDGINQEGRLFVLIGPRTLSSGLLNAVELRRSTKAILAGEPTGQRPNAYGEIRAFELPNSRLAVDYSTEFFQVVEGDPPALIPEVHVAVSSVDYFAGRDPVMEAVLAYPQRQGGAGATGSPPAAQTAGRADPHETGN